MFCLCFLLLRISEGSYLSRPRIHFSGSFRADVSTVNNAPENYRDGANVTGNLSWNPLGSGEFRLFDTNVTSVVYINGTQSTSDPIVGLPIFNSDILTSGKLVDLDVDAQLIKGEVWGMYTGLNWSKPSVVQHNAFQGYLQPANLAQNVWQRAICNCIQTEGIIFGGNCNHNMSSVLKSVLVNVSWADDAEIDSPALEQLKRLSQPGFLSVRLILFFMVRDPSPYNFTFGEVIGTIGPEFFDESNQFGSQRRLNYEEVQQPPPSFFPNVPQCQGWNVTAWLYDVPIRLNEIIGESLGNLSGNLTISADFGNAIVMDKHKNLLNLGTLLFGIVNQTTSNICFVNLGEIDYLQNNWLLNTAGVQEFPNFPNNSVQQNILSPIERDLVRNNPLAIILIPNTTSYNMDEQAAAEVRPEPVMLLMLPIMLLSTVTKHSLLCQFPPMWELDLLQLSCNLPNTFFLGGGELPLIRCICMLINQLSIEFLTIGKGF